MGYKVFLSYRRTDTEVATKLYQELSKRGRSVFFDTDALTTGDFKEKILANIQECVLFVSLLTTESLRRMYENANDDMVRREIEAAKKAGKPKLFFMLLDDPATQKGQLYNTLTAYQSDSLFVWLKNQNIIECQALDEDRSGVLGIQNAVDKVNQSLDGQWQSLKFSSGGVDFIYNGPVWDDSDPYGIGRAEEDSSRQERLLYDGEWEYDRNGRGTIYIVDSNKKSKSYTTGIGTLTSGRMTRMGLCIMTMDRCGFRDALMVLAPDTVHSIPLAERGRMFFKVACHLLSRTSLISATLKSSRVSGN